MSDTDTSGARFTNTHATGTTHTTYVLQPEPEPFPWHWPWQQRRTLIEIVEKAERLTFPPAKRKP